MERENNFILKLIKDSIKDFREAISKYLFFEVFFKLLTSFILIPFLFLTFRIFIKITGLKALINSEILNFGLRLKGVSGVIIISIIGFIILFIEQGVLIVIAEKNYFKQSTSVINALGITLLRTPEMVCFGIIQITLFIASFIALGGFGINSSLINKIQLLKFIGNKIFKYDLPMVIYIALLVSIYGILIKWIFVFHCIVVEKLSASKAMKKSCKLTKGNAIKIALTLLVWNLILIILFTAILMIIVLVLVLIANVFKVNTNKTSLQIYFTSFISIIIFAFSIFSIPLNINLITKLYYIQRSKFEVILQDEIEICEKISKAEFIEKKIYEYLKFNKKILAIIIVCIFLVGTVLGCYFINGVFFNIKKVKVTAHRANYNDAPENSFSAIKSCIDSKVDYAEIDVQETKDGMVVLMHDYDLKRLAGVKKAVRRLTFDDIEKLNIGLGSSDKYKGEKVPTLDQVIKVCKGKTKLIIELKPYGVGKELSEKVVDIIEKNDFVNECVIHSANYESLLNVKRLNPKIITGYIVYRPVGDIAHINVDFYSVEQSRITRKLVKSIHKKKKQIYAWTVDDEDDMNHMLDLNVDNIITDNPKLLINVIKYRK